MGEWLTMIEDCEKRQSKLTEWEVGFIDSIRKRIDDDLPLTEKQEEKLNAIWERVT